MLLSNPKKNLQSQFTCCKMPMNGTGFIFGYNGDDDRNIRKKRSTFLQLSGGDYLERRKYYYYHHRHQICDECCSLTHWYAFFRLSPLYLMVGLLTEIFTSYIADVSKFWIHDRTDLNCQRYVWGSWVVMTDIIWKFSVSFFLSCHFYPNFFLNIRMNLHTYRYWWRNILYIHNLFDHDELCMNWTWSMACEMQFFVMFTIILFFYAK